MRGLKHIFVYIPNPLQYRHKTLKLEPNTEDSALVSTFLSFTLFLYSRIEFGVSILQYF